MDDQKVVGRRIAAAIIDLLVIGGIFVAVGALTDNITSEDGTVSINLDGGPALLFLALTLAYYFVTELLAGRTLGKLVLGLRVVAEDGSRASGGQIAARTAMRLIDGLPFLYLVGLAAIAISGRDQRLGDRAANTLVVRG